MHKLTTLTAKPGKPAIRTGRLADAIIECTDDDLAQAIDQAKGTVELSNVFVRGGAGPHCVAGDLFRWIGGGASGKVRKYPAGYYGDISDAKLIKRVELISLLFSAGYNLYETILRVMGAESVLVNGGTYDGSQQKNKKEAWQIRHCRVGQFNQAHIFGSIVTGALKPASPGKAAEASPKSLEAYHADAEKFRTKLKFFGCTIGGHVRVTGQSDVEFIGCTFTGPDPRGNSPKTCINLESFTTVNGKKLRPTATATGCKFPGWKVPAGAGVVIK